MKIIEAISFQCKVCKKDNLIPYIATATKVLCVNCLNMQDNNIVRINQFEGLEITDFYCNGFFGRRYDLSGSIIIRNGSDYITIRDNEGEVHTAYFEKGWQQEEMEEYITNWTK